jgi:hypothetical protein
LKYIAWTRTQQQQKKKKERARETIRWADEYILVAAG